MSQLSDLHKAIEILRKEDVSTDDTIGCISLW